jgi:cysteine desulfurase/selenocysteine lyase
MTIPTPTSEGAAALPAYGRAGGPPIQVATLARLANEFFAALPGRASGGPALTAAGLPGAQQPVSLPSLPSAAALPAAGGLTLPANPLPPGAPAGPLPQATTTQFGGLGATAPGLNLLPTGPDQVAARLRPSAAQAPHAAAPNGPPDTLVQSATGFDGRLGGPTLGVPQAVAPTAPRSAGAPGFYFLDHAAASPTTAALVLPGLDAGPPGLFDIGTLLGEAPRLHAAPAGPTAPIAPAAPKAAPQDTAGAFYFVDPQRHPGPHGHHGGAVPDLGARSAGRIPFDVNAIRRDFPILSERVNGKQLVWFDNAATTQKPKAVIDRLVHFYQHENSNVHRAAHELAARSTDAYEKARSTVARFVGASSAEEIIFVRGCTEGINLIAKSWGDKHIGEGDEIIVSHLEHHANIVPWQQLAALKGAHLRVIPVDDSGQIIVSEYQRLLGPRTRLVSISQVSNALGTVVPVQEVVDIARRQGITTLVDGAQSVSHLALDVQALGCDFFVFSGHKVFGPTGIGAVYGRKAVLEDTPPWQGGGNMIADVTFERTVFQGVPARFEAGTGNIADAVGLGAALDYVQRIGLPHIERYEHELLAYATAAIQPIAGVRLIGTARDKASVLSFTLKGYAPEDVGRALNEEGIAVRSGHHCAQPILRRFGVEATVRPSFAFYNTCEEIDRLVAVVRRLARA